MNYYERTLGTQENPFPKTGIVYSMEDVSAFFWPDGKDDFYSKIENHFSGEFNIVVWNADLGLGKSHTFFFMKKYIEDNHLDWFCLYVVYDKISNGLRDIFSLLLSEVFKGPLIEKWKKQFSSAESILEKLELEYSYLPEVKLFWKLINEGSSEFSEIEIRKKFEILLKLFRNSYKKIIILIDQVEDILYGPGPEKQASRVLHEFRMIADENRNFLYLVLGTREESWDICTTSLYPAIKERATAESLKSLKKKEDILRFIGEYIPSKKRKEFLKHFENGILEIIRNKTQGRQRRLVKFSYLLIEELKKRNIKKNFTDSIYNICGDENIWVSVRFETRKRPYDAEKYSSPEILFQILNNLKNIPLIFFELREYEKTLKHWISSFQVKSKGKHHEFTICCSEKRWKELKKKLTKDSSENLIVFCRDPPKRKKNYNSLKKFEEWLRENKNDIKFTRLGYFSLDIEDSLDFLEEFCPEVYKILLEDLDE